MTSHLRPLCRLPLLLPFFFFAFFSTAEAQSGLTVTQNLRLWLKADLGVQTDANGNVSLWQDQSGHSIDASQSNSALRPLYDVSGINGHPSIRFNGTNQVLNFSAIDTADFTVFIVYGMTAHQSWSGPLNNAAPGKYGFQITSGAADTSIYVPHLVRWNGGSEISNKRAAASVTLPMSSRLQMWRSDDRYFQNGLEQNVVAGVGGWAANGGTIGKAWSFMAGDIAEILIYDTVLSDQDQQAVQAYLNDKYDVVEIPQPKITPDGGTYSNSATVALQSDTPGATLYYTTDGSTPNSNSTEYTGPFQLTQSATVKAFALLGTMPSQVASANFTVQGSFVPTSVSGLKLWYTGQAGIMQDTSGNVVQWLDQSGSGNHASQESASARPAYVSESINGQPALHFDGVSSRLNFTAVDTTHFTAFVVYNMNSHKAWSGPLNNAAAGKHGFQMVSGSSDTSVFVPELVKWDGSSETAATMTSTALNLPFGSSVHMWTSDGQFFKDGLQQTNLIPGVTGWSANGGTIGRAWDYMEGDIAEVLIFDRVLSAQERQSIEDYLSGRYDVIRIPQPQIAPGGGTYSGSATVTSQSNVPDAVIYYTTDGSDPTSESNVYTEPFELTSSCTVRAIAISGTMRSEITSIDFTIHEGFEPTSLPGLKLWLKADAGVQADGNGRVSLWKDQSGNSSDAAQIAAAQMPIHVADGINGQPSLRFNGTNQQLQFDALDTPNFTVFIVSNMTAHKAWSGPLNNAAPGKHGFQITSDSADTSTYIPHLVRWNGSAETANFRAAESNVLPMGSALQVWRSDNRFFKNGLEKTVSPGVSGWSANGGAIGKAWDFMAGDISEILIFDSVLSDEDQQQVQDYLNAKYDVVEIEKPRITPDGGTYSNSVIVSLESDVPDATIYYTTDGSTPTSESTPYTEPFELTATATVKAFAVLEPSSSQMTTATFTLQSGFAPTSVAGLKLWYTGQTGIVRNEAGQVSQWLDQSGNANHAVQENVSIRPTYAHASVNGRPAVHFDGLTNVLNFNAVDTTNFTTFVVFNMTAHKAWAGPLNNATPGKHGFQITSGSADTSTYLPHLVRWNGASETAVTRAFDAVTLPMTKSIHAWRSDGAFFKDGLQQNTAPGIGGWSPTGVTVGKAWDYMAGDIAEVLIFDGVLSEQDFQNVQTYLDNRYLQPNPDGDGDGMPDAWEMLYFGNLNQTAEGDADSDGLTNLQEWENGTHPMQSDTDGDGRSDGSEVLQGRNPLKGAIPDLNADVELRLFTPLE